MMTTLPTDSTARKDYALFRGCMRYFPAALAGVAKISKIGNDKHNPGQEMHHARNKSADHGDCILRHLMDVEDLLAAMNRGEQVSKEEILNEMSSVAWRALAMSQELHEKLGVAPLAPGAKMGDNEKKATTASDLYYAAEDAHKRIKEMMSQQVKFQKGDVVKNDGNDVEVTVEGTYFDENGRPILFVKDDGGKIFGVDPAAYKSIYKGK